MTDRKTQVKNQIVNFIKASKTGRRSMLSYGVEFEYQFDGNNSDCHCDMEDLYDMEAFYSHSYNNAAEYLDSECTDIDDIISSISLDEINKDIVKLHFPLYKMTLINKKTFRKKYGNDWDRPSSWAKVYKLRYQAKLEKLVRFHWGEFDTDDDKYVGEFLQEHHIFKNPIRTWYSAYDEAHQHQRDCIEEDMNYEDYRYDSHDCGDGGACIDTEFDWTEDQSVSGGEIRTVGGNSYNDILSHGSDIISEINSAHGAYVDTNCSAHLHIKLGDIGHYYGSGILHGLIMEYIYFNFTQLPESVKERLRNGGNRHIRPLFKNNKFTWVNFHSQGTIEFRLFGNISDSKDFETCVNFACDALAYAYKAKALRSRDNAYSRDDRLTRDSYLITRHLEAV